MTKIVLVTNPAILLFNYSFKLRSFNMIFQYIK